MRRLEELPAVVRFFSLFSESRTRKDMSAWRKYSVSLNTIGPAVGCVHRSSKWRSTSRHVMESFGPAASTASCTSPRSIPMSVWREAVVVLGVGVSVRNGQG